MLPVSINLAIRGRVLDTHVCLHIVSPPEALIICIVRQGAEKYVEPTWDAGEQIFWFIKFYLVQALNLENFTTLISGQF